MPKVAKIKVAKTAGKTIQYESRQSSAALIPKAANATSTIAIDTHKKPSREWVVVTPIKPNDIASIEAIAATTDRNSKTARLTKQIKRERILAPRMQRKKITQIMERIVLQGQGSRGTYQQERMQPAPKSLQIKACQKLRERAGLCSCQVAGGGYFPSEAASSEARHVFRKCSCAFQSEVSIQPQETPTKPPAITSLRKW